MLFDQVERAVSGAATFLCCQPADGHCRSTRCCFCRSRLWYSTVIMTGQLPRIVRKQNRHYSGSGAVVVVEHATGTLAPLHPPRGRNYRDGSNEVVFEALMVSLGVIVRHELRDRVLKRAPSVRAICCRA